MQTQDASNIQFDVLLSPVVGVHRNKISRLGKPVDDYLDGVKLVGRGRQTHNKIHANVFPFPCRDIQRLQQYSRPHMFGLDPSACVAFCNIVSSLVLHSSPLELRFQIMIHLCAAGVDGIF
jgi:hypothetical protein